MTIPGVGVTVAVGLVAAIGEVERFDSPGKLAAYFGLVPRISQSAGRCYHGRITKSGNSTARHLAIDPETGDLTHSFSSLAEEAARNALEMAGLEPNEIDLLIISCPS